VMPILATKVADLPGPPATVAAIQREAIRTAVSTRREPTAVFNALADLIARGDQIPAAAQGLRVLPRASWPLDSAAATARILVAWAANTHPSERTERDIFGHLRRDYSETVQVADDLLGTLPAAEAETLRATLAGLRVAVFTVTTVPEEMRFDTARLVVEAGKPFEIIFENIDGLPHNLVVVKPGTRERVGLAAMTLLPEQLDWNGRAYVPDSPDVIAATKILETDQLATLKISELTSEGIYEFVCTFPGHWAMMYGQLVITKNVSAYLKDHPLPPKQPLVTTVELCDPRINQALASTSGDSRLTP